MPSGWQVGVAAYEAARAMAEQSLRLGHDVVVDAVNDSEPARQAWRTAAARTGAHIEFVYLMISDSREHERRLSGRDRGLAYVGEPTWTDVQHRRADYAAWADEVLEFDTAARTADEIAGALTTRLSTK
ncbi:AAA family ATPase [Janibacter indicus]|uniref:AAA family ATPase n=1 Tax=Janibacter indicus TaxID=857417 RepID=UPI003EB6DAF5